MNIHPFCFPAILTISPVEIHNPIVCVISAVIMPGNVISYHRSYLSLSYHLLLFAYPGFTCTVVRRVRYLMRKQATYQGERYECAEGYEHWATSATRAYTTQLVAGEVGGKATCECSQYQSLGERQSITSSNLP